MAPKSTAIGIDLGTTYTVASVIEGDSVKTIPFEGGQRLFPSIISINEKDQFLVGFNAQRNLVVRPTETFYSMIVYLLTPWLFFIVAYSYFISRSKNV